MMGCTIWIQTSFISAIPGILQSFVMQSDLTGYIQFTSRAFFVRMASMLVGVAQQYLQSGVTIMWRERITRSITDRYLKDNNFYTMSHVDRRIPDADQRISLEVNQFVQSLSMLYSPWRGIVRTFLDSIYVTVLLLRVQLPLSGLIAMVSYGTIGMGIIRICAPDFTHFNVESERRSAEFRAAHNHVNNALESIAFSDGGRAAERDLNESHQAVLEVMNKSNNQSSLWQPVQSFMTMSLPMYIRQALQFMWSFGEGTDKQVLSNRGGVQMQETSQYIGTLIQQAFQTMSSIMSMHQQFSYLFGGARRISDVLLVLDELDKEREADASRLLASVEPATPRRGERLCLSGANIIAPDGRCLARELTISVEAHGRSNLLLVGSNGVGKSAVARVLSGLWQPKAGKVGRPLSLVVVPQLPLVPTLALSLLDTVTYPLQLKHGSAEESEAVAVLLPLMQKLRVGYLIERSADGWHSVSAWDTVLSMGEQQALGFIRALFHNPTWAVLDECTSAMAEDVAEVCYEILEEKGVSVLSVSQSAEALLRCVLY